MRETNLTGARAELIHSPTVRAAWFTNARFFAVALSLVTFTSVFGQPVITQQPANQSVSPGATATFQVTASGLAPLSYQWRFIALDLPSETNRALSITNTQLVNAGDYAAIVTDRSGSVTSRVAHLEVDTTFTKITAGRIVTDLEDSEQVGWGDYDNDGYIDLIVGNSDSRSLYRNNGEGSFTKVTSGTIVTDSIGSGNPVWGDYDNDGFLDLYVGNKYVRKNALYHNDGTGSFTKVLTGALVGDGPGANGVGWGDYNNDGYLDLLVTNFDLPNALYRNRGDGTFEKIAGHQAGPVDSYDGISIAASWADYDGDGDLDALITVGRRQSNNLFYRNNGNGMFTQLFKPDIGALDDAPGYWGPPSWFDYDNDGDLDVFISNGGFFERLNDAFYRNDGGTFTKMTTNQVGLIVADGKTGMGTGAADYDNDGYVDLFVAVPSLTLGGETGDDNLLYRNNGDGTFSRTTAGSLVHDRGASTACAWGDYDNDGFMDLVVANGFGARNNFLYRNNGNTNHWLKLKLIGTTSNRGAMGTKVRIKATINGRTFWQLRMAHDNDGYDSQHDPRPNFGLGDAPVAETVRIEWPSGIVDEMHNVPADQILNVTEPVRLQATGRGNFEFRSWKKQVFGVEASTDLLAWSSLGSVTNTSGLIQFSEEALSTAARFYRVLTK